MQRALRSISLLGVLGAVVVLSGCATAGSHHAVEAANTDLSKFKQIDVTISSKASGAGEVLDTIQNEVMKELQSKFDYTPGETGKAAPGVLGVKLDVVSFGRANRVARIFLGPLAGSDTITVEGELIDRGTGKRIGTFTSSGEFRGGGIIIGDAGVQRAAARLGEEILAHLEGREI